MQNELKTLIENIKNKAIKEYNDFKETILTKSPIVIFNNSYKISNYNDLLDYFKYDGFSDLMENRFTDFEKNRNEYNENFNNLKEFSSKPILDTIYDIHSNYNLYLSSWKNIDTIFDDYILSKDY